jgi:hypothetical protein
MKFERTARFDSDFASLRHEHQQQFRVLVPDFHGACEQYVQSGGRSAWPKRLRIRRMTSAVGIWEMTWSFASPDGRATFEFVSREGETRVLWRRIGDHGIYTSP